MEASFNPEAKVGVMGGEENDLFCASSSLDESSCDTVDSSTAPHLLEDDISSSSSYMRCPLYEMSDLMADLPIKRGLSKHFQGKSQSFTSLSSVMCLEDLAKPLKPCKKKLKPCNKSFGGKLDIHVALGCTSRIISKNKQSKDSSLITMLGRRHVGFLGIRNRFPVQPQRSTSFSAAHKLMFA